MGLYGPCQVDVLGGLRRTQNIKQQELGVKKYQLFLPQDLPRLLALLGDKYSEGGFSVGISHPGEGKGARSRDQ